MGALEQKVTLNLADLDQGTKDQLAKELETQGVDLAKFVTSAIAEKIQRDDWLRQEIGKGMADLDAGRVHALEEVKDSISVVIADAKAGVAAE